MFDFRRATVFCLRHRFSKHKMTRYAKNLGQMALLATPMSVRRTVQLLTRSVGYILDILFSDLAMDNQNTVEH